VQIVNKKCETLKYTYITIFHSIIEKEERELENPNPRQGVEQDPGIWNEIQVVLRCSPLEMDRAG